MVDIKERKRVINAPDLIIICCIFILAAVFCLANTGNYLQYIESDIGGETLLGRVIAESHSLIPSTWSASTELRVISMPNLAALIYCICSNMNLSAGIACCLFFLLFLLVVWKYIRCLGLRKEAGACVLILIMTLSWNVHDYLEMFILYACYYGSHLIALFIIMLLYERMLRKDDSRRIYVFLAATVILSALIGMQGVRGLLIVYIPLILTEILRLIILQIRSIRREHNRISAYSGFKHARILLWLLVCTGVSWFFTRFGVNFGNSVSRNIRQGPYKMFHEVLPDAFALFDRFPITIAAFTVFFICAMIGYALHIREGGTFSVLVLPISALTSMLAGAFTTVDSTPRYYIVVVISVAFGTGILINQLLTSRHVNCAGTLKLMLIALSAAAIIHYSSSLLIRADDEMNDERKVVEYLTEQTCSLGYSTFDFANMFAAMSNGRLTVGSIDFETMKGVHWLTDSRWYPPDCDSGEPCFYIATDANAPTLNATFDRMNIERSESAVIGKYHIYISDHNDVQWE